MENNYQQERVLGLVTELFELTSNLQHITDIKGASLGSFNKLADEMDSEINANKEFGGPYISGKSIQSFIKDGILPKKTVHDKLAAYRLYLSDKTIWTQQLLLKKLLTKTEYRKDYFWREYLKFDKSRRKPVGQLQEQDQFGKFTSIPNKFLRKDYFNRLANLANTQFLLIIEGVTGSGKTELLTAFVEESKKTQSYKTIIQPTISENYTFDMLLADQEALSIKETLSPGVKVDKLIQLLLSEDILLVLDNFENVQEDSFAILVEKAATLQGKVRVVISHNERFKMLYSRPKNILHIEGYSSAELKEVLSQNEIEIDAVAMQLILSKTDGIPFAVDIFIELAKSSYFNIDKKIESLTIDEDYRGWIASILNSLDPKHRKLLETLSLIEGEFTAVDALSIGELIGFADPKPIVEGLADKLILSQTQVGTNVFLRMLKPVHEYVGTLHITEEVKRRHILLANYFWPQVNFAKKKQYDQQDLVLIVKAIGHLQKAGNFHSAEYYLNYCLKFLKRFGMYQSIIGITKYQFENQKDHSMRMHWEYAHATFVTGHTGLAYSIILPLISNHFNKNLNGSSGETYDKLIASTIKYLQLYCEVLEQLDKPGLALSLLLDSITLFDITEYDWQLRSHAVSVIAWLYFKHGDVEKSIEINSDLLNDLDISVRGKAIACTRLGIALLEQGEVDTAEKNFHKAFELFNNERHKDIRALVWCSRYQALSLYKRGLHLQADIHLEYCLTNSAQLGLYENEYRSMLPIFKDYLVSENLITMLDKEINRTNERYKRNCSYLEQVDVQEDYERIKVLVGDRKDEKFDYRALLKPIDHTPKPIRSRASRSVINRAKSDPLTVIENIFARKQDLKSIFGCHFYNKLITECLKASENKSEILDKYIIRNISVISEQNNMQDDLKFHYARALQYAGDEDHALLLLALIDENNRNLEFHIIKGNCYKKTNFNTSYEEYKMAEKLAFSSREKGRVCNNIALLIFTKKRKDLYEEAKKMCEDAREYWKRSWDKSLYPITTRILIEIEESSLDNVVANAKNLVQTYGLWDNQAEEIFMKVDDQVKKKKLLLSIRG